MPRQFDESAPIQGQEGFRVVFVELEFLEEFFASRREFKDKTLRFKPDAAKFVRFADVVDGDPGAQGEGFGLDLDTRIYKFKEENQYDVLAVRIGKIYRKAAVREDKLLAPSGPENGTAGGSAGDTGSAGQNARRAG